MANVLCPACLQAGHRTKSDDLGGGHYRCRACRGLHDGEPDEGGDYHDADPSRRLEREDEALKQRLGGGPLRRKAR